VRHPANVRDRRREKGSRKGAISPLIAGHSAHAADISACEVAIFRRSPTRGRAMNESARRHRPSGTDHSQPNVPQDGFPPTPAGNDAARRRENDHERRD
jgi:hypothetical protein